MRVVLATKMEVLADANVSPPSRLDVTNPIELENYNTVRVDVQIVATKTSTNQLTVTHEISNDAEKWSTVAYTILGNGIDSPVGFYLLPSVTGLSARYHRTSLAVGDETPENPKGAVVSIGIFSTAF